MRPKADLFLLDLILLHLNHLLMIKFLQQQTQSRLAAAMSGHSKSGHWSRCSGRAYPFIQALNS